MEVNDIPEFRGLEEHKQYFEEQINILKEIWELTREYYGIPDPHIGNTDFGVTKEWWNG